MNKIRKMFEGNYETKTPNKFANTKIYIAVSVIGCLFCLLSFILALIYQNTITCVLFLLALLVCLNCGIEYFKRKKNK